MSFTRAFLEKVDVLYRHRRTPISSVIPTQRRAADKAAAYGLASIVVNGNDVHAVRGVIGAAVTLARLGGGPSLIEGYFSRTTAYAKLRNMGKAVEMVRAEL